MFPHYFVPSFLRFFVPCRLRATLLDSLLRASWSRRRAVHAHALAPSKLVTTASSSLPSPPKIPCRLRPTLIAGGPFCWPPRFHLSDPVLPVLYALPGRGGEIYMTVAPSKHVECCRVPLTGYSRVGLRSARVGHTQVPILALYMTASSRSSLSPLKLRRPVNHHPCDRATAP